MLELLLFFLVVRDVSRDVGRRVEGDRAVAFHEPHSSVQLEPEQLPEQFLVLFLEEKSRSIYG